ncbi:tyramine beta-hydroxylase [Agrilus planipennis]|uniref:Tyramine beta-hydroxylase n=1 Tax=Agrilus planipennis TaxID=224129 RepID=A0A1W4WN56_AGRPL|nr:tyramine beta-hydroxylase [Agrilus planipennis]
MNVLHLRIILTCCAVLFHSFSPMLTTNRIHKEIYHIPLDEKSELTLDWIVDYPLKTVTFEIHIPIKFGWFAIGFSDRGEHFSADYCVLWYDWKHELHFEDAWADDQAKLTADEQQDCKSFKKIIRGNKMKFSFQRKFDTCDKNDYLIEDGTVHIVWSRGHEKLYKLQGLNITVSKENNGMVRTELLKNIEVNIQLPTESTSLDILADQVTVPSDETTYWCHVHKLPSKFKRKHHIVEYKPVIQTGNEGLVHHMEVFHCIAPATENIAIYVGPCFSTKRPHNTHVCKRVLAAWAMGAKSFVYPEEAGLPIGGPDFNPYIMLEVHYNNPEKRNDWIDSSGIRFDIVSKLRPMDAGVIELGLEYTDKMAIPPNQEEFSLSGYCIVECTAVSLPPEGIVVFGSQLHTHLTGVRVFTRHIRDGRELPELNRDNHYSTHFQEIRRLKRRVKILPGDALITTCIYNTVKRENVTLGGFAISDEMCVNYIHYFPSTTLEVCKSAISDHALSTYFKYMHDWEGQMTAGKVISENYKAIEWNPMRVQLLHELYREAPLSMQCNMSSGDRFPGYWENSSVTPILLPNPPPVRQCS